MSDEKKTVLSMRHINKTFPGVKALSDAQLTLREGEIHALMGEMVQEIYTDQSSYRS